MHNLRFAALVSLLTGCSLINSLDKVKPEADDAGNGGGSGKKGSGGTPVDAGAGGTMSGGRGASGGTGGASGGSGGLDSGTDASEGGTGASGGSGGGSGTPDAGDAGDGGDSFTAGGPGGAIVLYNPTGKNIYVLDPTDGHQLSTEPSPRVVAIANDPVTDNWYFFRQTGKISEPAELVVRQLNTTTGAWKNLGLPVTVPIPLLPSVGVLNGRIAYLSTPDPTNGDQTMVGLTVVDTTNPSKPAINNTNKNRTLPAGVKLGLIANPNPLAVGGSVTVVLQQAAPCTGNCDVSLLREIINGSTVAEDSMSKTIGSVNPTGGSIGFAFDYNNSLDVVLIPPTDLPAGTPSACAQNQGVNGSVIELNPSHDTLVGPITFDIASTRVNAAAFDSCHKIAFATSLLNDPAIWSIPMVPGGTPQKLCSTPGGPMLFEPYSHALLRLPTTRMDRIELYDIVDKNAMMPTLNQRTLNLPGGFVAGSVIAVRHPINPPCK